MLVFGSETANQSLARFREAVMAIRKAHDDKTVVIVAHGTVISLFMAWMTGCDGYRLRRKLGLPSFTVLDIKFKTVMDTFDMESER
jgi:broad specificity phosphatase PhoE